MGGAFWSAGGWPAVAGYIGALLALQAAVTVRLARLDEPAAP